MAAIKLCFICGYCDNRWTEDKHSWQTNDPKCAKCGEKKMLKVKELTPETRDVFGYRFSPPFPPKYQPNDYRYSRYSD